MSRNGRRKGKVLPIIELQIEQSTLQLIWDRINASTGWRRPMFHAYRMRNQLEWFEWFALSCYTQGLLDGLHVAKYHPETPKEVHR